MFQTQWQTLLRCSHRQISIRKIGGIPGKPFNGFRQPPFLSWKTVAVFTVMGASVAYSEVLFEQYCSFTHLDDTDPMLPVRLEYELKNLPLFQKLTNPRLSKNWIRLNTWENLDRNVLESKSGEPMVKDQSEYKLTSLTNKTLAKAGGILVQPAIFHNVANDETISIVHMGHRLCGYPFIIHGGMIATLLNETFKRNASLASSNASTLKDDFKVEDLSISYKRPAIAYQFFVVKTRRTEGDSGGKNSILLESVIESESGKILVESKAVLRNTGRASMLSCEKQASKWVLF